MKPTLRQITTTPEYSFLVRKDIGGNMINNWHYHPEIEILYIQRSVGTWLIGDHIGYYKTGDVVIIGPNLPHCFRHEYDYIMKRDETAKRNHLHKIFTRDIRGTIFEPARMQRD